ncbi:MAG: hypothetical protein ACHP7O_05450, partial [Burkholderiales bacterium]
MNIHEEHSATNLTLPKAVYVLQDLHGVQTYEDFYAVRHPSAAYNISLDLIARRVIAVVDRLSETQQQLQFAVDQKTISDDPLLEAMDHLLDALMEHIDVCGAIIRSFFSPDDNKRFDKILRDFKTSIKLYGKHIGCIDNYIKHNQGKLCSVRFQWSTGICIGYFVEGPVKGGGLGPVEIIHPGENTAFSFNRDIRYHVCSVFAIGSRLAHALHTVDKRLVATPVAKEAGIRDTNWSKVIDMVAALPTVFFPDEDVKDVPNVHKSENKVLIEYPAKHVRVSVPPSRSQISLSYG